MKDNRTVLAVMAHPDDIEFLCGGALGRLKKLGYTIHMANVSAGDCGSMEHGPDEIARIRFAEAREAGEVISATHHCVGARDALIMYDEPTLRAVVELVRRVNPFLVITNSPVCYMVDHEIVAKLAQTATFIAGAPNFQTLLTPPARPTQDVPYLYYADAVEGKDRFGQHVPASFYVDITREIKTKERMLKCHASQRDWLLKHHKVDEYIANMRRWNAASGQRCGVAFAEGFRQHLGHSYPQDNKLGDLLGAIPA
ncbi:MAG: PIG-L family deacetylase [Planctomycetes bacterium]|nr:PIG-L family deacetylase [Planctomycetota bacterium]